MDHLSKEKRSWNMSRIRSKGTEPEIVFRKLIHRAGFRYRLYAKIDGNIVRDKKNKRELKKNGWKIFTVWECELKEQESVLKKFKTFVRMDVERV